MLRQHKLNDPMCLAKGPPNLMQRLPVLPAPPHIVPLLLRKLEAPPKCHKHHLIEKDLYQMVLHRPVEPAGLIGRWESAPLVPRLQERARFVEWQAREPWVQSVWITVSKVAQEIRLNVTFGKELLLAPETRLPGGKELLVHLAVIKAGHRPAIEAERPRGDDQVRAL